MYFYQFLKLLTKIINFTNIKKLNIINRFVAKTTQTNIILKRGFTLNLLPSFQPPKILDLISENKEFKSEEANLRELYFCADFKITGNAHHVVTNNSKKRIALLWDSSRSRKIADKEVEFKLRISS